MKKQSSFWLLAALLALPLFSFSQTWTKEEQAFLDDYQKKFDQLSNKPITWENWIAVVRPDDDLTTWDTNQGLPSTLNAEKTWFMNATKQGLIANYSHFRPIRIIIEGELTLFWYYEYNSWKDNTGKIYELEDKRFLVFKRDGTGWKFLGGMVDPVDVKD